MDSKRIRKLEKQLKQAMQYAELMADKPVALAHMSARIEMLCLQLVHEMYGTLDTRARLMSKVYNAIRRCTDPECVAWKDYGGRGITVYPPWVADKKLFLEYLMTLPWHEDPDSWLDRRDNDRGYEPGNLRFVTPKVSANNTRRQKK